MLTEKEKMQRAKYYLLMLCSGVDPVTKKPVDENTLKNGRIIKCFQYISGVLDGAIDGNNASADRKSLKTKTDFYITDDEIKRVELITGGCTISEFTSAINEAVNDGYRKKLQSKTVNDWLVKKGYLKNSVNDAGKTHRELTEYSSEIGITSLLDAGSFGKYTIILYSEDAQRFILTHINEILEMAKEK